jgi:hypothetical protein
VFDRVVRLIAWTASPSRVMFAVRPRATQLGTYLGTCSTVDRKVQTMAVARLSPAAASPSMSRWRVAESSGVQDPWTSTSASHFGSSQDREARE